MRLPIERIVLTQKFCLIVVLYRVIFAYTRLTPTIILISINVAPLILILYGRTARWAVSFSFPTLPK